MTEPLAQMLACRLLIISGKGGTGKTRVAAALAVAAARAGLDTVVIELGGRALIPRLLRGAAGPPQQGNGRTPTRIGPHLYTLRLDPLEALKEYLELQLHIRPLVGAIVGNTGFRRLLDAAPGWRELITLGKLWHLETRMEGGGPRWDLLIVDAPATGHGLSLLSAPQVVVDTVKLGPLRRHTEWVQALIQDPQRTLIVPVSLPEELPVKETLELCERVRELGLAVGPLIANGVEPAPRLEDADALRAQLQRLRPEDTAPLPAPGTLWSLVEHATQRAALQASFLRELRQQTGHSLVILPYLSQGVQDRASVELLADALSTPQSDTA